MQRAREKFGFSGEVHIPADFRFGTKQHLFISISIISYYVILRLILVISALRGHFC